MRDVCLYTINSQQRTADSVDHLLGGSIFARHVLSSNPQQISSTISEAYGKLTPSYKEHTALQRLLGQAKQYFALESQHQHGAFDKTGGFNMFFIFTPILGEDEPILTFFQKG